MSDESRASAGVGTVILEAARRQNDKQDARLESYKRQAVVVAGGYLSTGTVTIAAMNSGSTDLVAAVVLAWSLVVGAMAGYVQWLARRWAETTDVTFLLHRGNGLRLGHMAVELRLAATLEKQFHLNERTLYRVARSLVSQAVVAISGVCVLIGALLW